MSSQPMSPDDLHRWQTLCAHWRETVPDPLRCHACQASLWDQAAWRMCGGCDLPYCLACACPHVHTPRTTCTGRLFIVPPGYPVPSFPERHYTTEVREDGSTVLHEYVP